ncbi:3668_t:CDS:2, partial [Cetraspora pellucida]
IAISEIPKPNIDLQKSKCYQKISKKMPSHEKTFEETTPQGMSVDLQHESEIFISDLEILNGGASFQVTFKGKGIFKELSSQETFIESMSQD